MRSIGRRYACFLRAGVDPSSSGLVLVLFLVSSFSTAKAAFFLLICVLLPAVPASGCGPILFLNFAIAASDFHFSDLVKVFLGGSQSCF
jgi:hypothetical protein